MKKSKQEKVEELADDIKKLSPAGQAVVGAVLDMKRGEAPDIFLWANQADAHKRELEIDLFLYTKGFTVYATAYDNELKAHLKVLFLYDMINHVQTGAATGMAVKAIADSEGDDNTLEYLPLESVAHAQEVIEQIAYGEESLELFRESDHELKKVRGIIARFTAPGMEPFYIVKHQPQTQILKGAITYSFTSDNRFTPMAAAAAVRISAGNETMIVDGQVFVFNESKFVRQFGYDARSAAVLANKIVQIEQTFKLTYPEGVSMRELADGNKSLCDKLLRADPASITQDQIVEQADEFGLALMTDDAEGRIIIMDKRDATMFANLLNDDYVDSNMTGIHYLATKKKEVQATEDAQINMGL